MIYFNQKPGCFQSWPGQWIRDSISVKEPNRFQRSKTKHIKLIVDAAYDSIEDKKIEALMVAFQDLFKGDSVIGPDGEPMKLGKFPVIDATISKAGLLNAGGDTYPEDVMVRAVTVSEDNKSRAAITDGNFPNVSVGDASVLKEEANGRVISKKKSRYKLRWIFVGGLCFLGIELISLWSAWKDIVDYIVR